uniref:Centromere protein S n=1 Tax=Oryzias sinensis TaxID=183150 RepID=A0A8C8DP41_9TELE
SLCVLDNGNRLRLKAAVHFTTGRICQKMGEDHRKEFSRQTVAAIAETAFRQCGEGFLGLLAR